VGSELLGYRLEALIGRGGMGVVYRAHDARLKRDVALKVLAPELGEDARFRERFLHESELAASLEHPNVVPIHDAGEADGRLYIVMRLVDGGDLKELLRDGPLEPARALRIVEQVADALDAAHARGLVHRDVKPSNVLLDGSEHAYLADFGLTRRLSDPRGTGDERSLGTVDYVAPEQIRGEEVDGRADLYALGCLLCECLTGQPPFVRSSEAAVLFAHLEEEPAAPDGLETLVPKALAKDPDDRFQTGSELVETALAALGIAEPRAPRWPFAAAAVGLLLIGAALLAFFLTGGGGSGSAPAAQGGRLLRIDPASNRVTESAPVGDGPTAVAVGSGRVWVTAYRDSSLWQLDPRGGGVAKIATVGRPSAVTTYDGKAYVAASGPGQFSGNVTRFDAVTGGREGGIPLLACSLAGGPSGLWVAGCPNVQQLSTEGATPQVLSTVLIPYARPLSAENYREALPGLAEGEGAVWVMGDAADHRLWRIDPGRHRIAATIPLSFPPGGVAAGDGAVWVTDQLGDRLVRVDPTANRIVRAIPVGRGARGVAVGPGGVWVTGAIDHTVTRVDPVTNRVVATIRVAASPVAVEGGEGSVWVVGDAR
jgi:streptogramin lyase